MLAAALVRIHDFAQEPDTNKNRRNFCVNFPSILNLSYQTQKKNRNNKNLKHYFVSGSTPPHSTLGSRFFHLGFTLGFRAFALVVRELTLSLKMLATWQRLRNTAFVRNSLL